MSRPVRLTNRARRDLRQVDPAAAGQIIEALEQLAETGRGDVTRLRGIEREWRLRVGDWRVRFTYEERTLVVLRILPRGRAYR